MVGDDANEVPMEVASTLRNIGEFEKVALDGAAQRTAR